MWPSDYCQFVHSLSATTSASVDSLLYVTALNNDKAAVVQPHAFIVVRRGDALRKDASCRRQENRVHLRQTTALAALLTLVVANDRTFVVLFL